MKNTEKNISIELLRILSMFLIVLSHCCVHGLNSFDSTRVYNNIFLDIFTLGNLGVAIFVIITGYLSVDKKFKLKKIIQLELSILFYSILLFVITSLITNNNIFSINLIKSIFPILFEKYWFMTAYMALYIFTPFINRLVSQLERTEFEKLIFICVFLVFVIPTFTTYDLYFNELFQFITFYCIGAYIKKYINSMKYTKKINFTLLFLILFLIISSIIIVLISQKFPFILKYGTYFFNRNSIFILLLAVCIFLVFLRKNISSNKLINVVSSATLGVYLLHDNPDFRGILWKNILKLNRFVDSPYLILILFVSAILIFSICIVLELIRKKIFDEFNNKIAICLETKIIKNYRTVCTKIKEDVHEKENRNN